jgi:hypothetical protein
MNAHPGERVSYTTTNKQTTRAKRLLRELEHQAARPGVR